MTIATSTTTQALFLDDTTKVILEYYSPVNNLLTLQVDTSAISYSDITTDLTSYTWDTVAETLNKRIYCPIVNTGYIA